MFHLGLTLYVWFSRHNNREGVFLNLSVTVGSTVPLELPTISDLVGLSPVQY